MQLRIGTHRGFTIIELMVVVALVGTMVALIVPNLGTFMRHNRLSNAGNDLLRSLNVARTEAIKRQLPMATGGGLAPGVVLCASNNTDGLADSSLTCNGGQFLDWFVFVDANGNGAHEATEPVIERHGPLHQTLMPRSNNSGRITYNAAGFAYPFVGGGLLPVRDIVVCDSYGVPQQGANTTARSVRLTATGRATVSHAYATVTAALAATGQTCP